MATRSTEPLAARSISRRAFEMFRNSALNNNNPGSQGKSHILLSNAKTEKVKINDAVLTSSVEEKLLGVTLDS